MNLAAEMEAYRARRAEIDRRVDAGEHIEPCFTCKAPSTHRSRRITPGGYKAYACDDHAVDETTLWGADPGWLTEYEPVIRNDNHADPVHEERNPQ